MLLAAYRQGELVGAKCLLFGSGGWQSCDGTEFYPAVSSKNAVRLLSELLS